MLRSFSYAAHLGLDRFADSGAAAASPLAAWAAFWERSVASAFLSGYLDTIDANPALLPAAGQAQALLDACVLEKALYEVQYELNNRPVWLRIPLAGILAL